MSAGIYIRDECMNKLKSIRSGIDDPMVYAEHAVMILVRVLHNLKRAERQIEAKRCK